MPDPIDEAVEARQRELIDAAATLYAAQTVCGSHVREKSKAAFRRLIDAHLLITGVLATGLLRIDGKVTSFTEAGEERDALFASYIIGMDLCERAIEEGRYLQAQALLRQEMETVAQLKAVSRGSRKEHRAPNVTVLEASLRRLYAELSAAAHVSKHHIVRAATEVTVTGEDLPGPTSGTRFSPAFDEDVGRRSFALHLMLTVAFLEEFSIDMDLRHGDDGFTTREVDAVNLALELMRAEGVIELDA